MQDERLPIVPATRGLRKNLGGPSSRMPVRMYLAPPAAFTGPLGALNGDVARLTSLVLGGWCLSHVANPAEANALGE